jgi:rhodanese-related sulfurtransferase
MEQISVQELNAWLNDDRRARPVLLDVREADEFAAYRIAGSLPMPMGSIPVRLHEIDRQAAVVMVCRSGARSFHAGLFLKQNGFERVYNLAGGVIAWARDVERAAA